MTIAENRRIKLVYKGGILHKVLTSGGYVETSDSTQALLTTPAYRFFLTDHLGSVRVVVDAAGNVLQRNDYLPYGEDYVATYAPGGDILAGLNIPLIIEEEDDDEEEENLEGGNRFGEIDEGDEEDPGDDVVGVIGPEYYRSYNAYRFSGKEQVWGLYDFGARWFTPKRAHWTTMDPLAEKYYPISPYAYCAGNPVNLVDPEGKDWYTNNETGYYTWFEGNEEIEGYTYYGEKGSLLGEAEDMLNKLFFELYNNRDKHFEGEMPASIYTDGFTFSIRQSNLRSISGGEDDSGLFGEFVNNSGPEYSVLLRDHPFIDDLNKTEFIKQAQDRIKKSISGYLITKRNWTPFDVVKTGLVESEQFIGSYTYYGKLDNNRKELYNIVYDSKSRTSLFYHLNIFNKSRGQSSSMGNTYQFYIWKTNL